MKEKRLPCFLVLLIITLAAGLVLGATYMLTEKPIAEQQLKQQEDARRAVLPEASVFEVCEANGLDWLYRGIGADGSTVGYAAQITASGFHGEIEVITGIKADGTIAGISVGGANFSETAGLGAKAKEEPFTGQFRGKNVPLTVIKTGENQTASTVDAITSATITSRAVTDAVNRTAALVLGGAEK